jgi:hypothetical protein
MIGCCVTEQLFPTGSIQQLRAAQDSAGLNRTISADSAAGIEHRWPANFFVPHGFFHASA